jgi:hypothetical protein
MTRLFAWPSVVGRGGVEPPTFRFQVWFEHARASAGLLLEFASDLSWSCPVRHLWLHPLLHTGQDGRGGRADDTVVTDVAST